MKFTIRDLLWLTVVVALGAGWWHYKQITTTAAAEQEELWKKCVWRVLEDGHRKSGRPMEVSTPDGELIGISSGANNPTPDSIEVGRRVEGSPATLRDRRIELLVEKFAEARISASQQSDDIASALIDLGKQVSARVRYSQSRSVVTDINVIVDSPVSDGENHATFRACRIQFEPDGSYLVHFLPDSIER